MSGAGKIIIYHTTSSYSINSADKKTFSEIDRVKQGTDFPELDQATFAPGQAQPGESVQLSYKQKAIRINYMHACRGASRRTQESSCGEQVYCVAGEISGWRKTVLVIHETQYQNV
jgi:hypothetical protein